MIDVEKLDVEEGSEKQFTDILLVSGDAGLKVGVPFVDGASVTADVLEQAKAPKVISYKFKRRKGYHLTVGHRRQITKLKIKTITV